MVIRRAGKEKQLAHTLDLTETSARLGGLASPLEPGEIVEVQRGAVKAKFQVIWMGAQGSALAFQAGIRALDPNKCVWNIDLPADEIDIAVDAGRLRQPMPPVQNSAEFPGERRWHPRYVCSGSVAAKTANSTFAARGEAKDISKGGVYVELHAPLPVNSTVSLDLCIEDIRFEAAGLVRTSYPLLGMGVCFQKLTPENAEKLALVVEKAKRKSEVERSPASVVLDVLEGSGAVTPGISFSFGPEENPAPMLTKACRSLVQHFDRWKHVCPPSEVQELKAAIEQLHQKFSPGAENVFVEYVPDPIRTSEVV
jgi:hypothetical protein